jgi:hypothetical protein
VWWRGVQVDLVQTKPLDDQSLVGVQYCAATPAGTPILACSYDNGVMPIVL